MGSPVVRVPLSSSQQRIYFLCRLAPSSSSWLMRRRLALRGPLDLDALVAALRMLQERHPALRIRLASDGSELHQVVVEQTVEPTVHEWSEASPDERDARIAAVDASHVRPIDLHAEPFLRVDVARLGRDDHLLWLTVHHIVCDGWSMRVMVRDLDELYTACTSARAPTLPAIPVTYLEYVTWEDERARTAEHAKHLGYWCDHLRGVAPPALPYDLHVRPALAEPRAQRSGKWYFEIDAALRAAIERLGTQADVTPFVVYLAAFKLLLARYAGSDDIAVAVPAANRSQRETRDLVGQLFNNILLRTNLAGAESFREVLAREREVVLDGIAHQHVPYDEVIRAVDGLPLFNVLFHPPIGRTGPITLGALEVADARNDIETADADLSVHFLPEAEKQADHRMRVAISYDRARFSAELIARVGTQFQRILAVVVEAPDRSLVELDLVSADELAPLTAARASSRPARTSTTDYVAPSTPTEHALAAIWRDVLGVERVGIRDDFFAVGGHSLLAIRLLAAIERGLDVKLPLRELFVDSTLGGLAARVDDARGSHGSLERPKLYASATQSARLPAAVRGVFKLDKLATSDLFARHVWSAWIDGPLDLPSLERAVAALRVRHALLRTRFFDGTEREMFEVLDPADVERFALLERADVSSLSGTEQEQADADFHRSASFRPLAIGQGEVMNIALSRWTPTRHRLTVSLHNIVSDGESLAIYVNELGELWRDPGAVLPPAPLQFSHLADYLERVRESEVGRAQRAFWKARLEGIPPLELPNDLPREQVDARREANGGVVAFPAGSVVRELPTEVLTAIERIAESQRATVMSTLIAAMAGYLSQRTSQRDLAFITRLSYRHLSGLERALGFLVNPILLRVSTEGAPAFADLVARTHAVVTDAFDHGEYDMFELAPSSAFRFCFVYTRATRSGESSTELPDGLLATPAPQPGASAGIQIGYDLVLWLKHSDDHVRLHLAYNAELFSGTAAAAFLEEYARYVADQVPSANAGISVTSSITAPRG